jgi:hypothetical protein
MPDLHSERDQNVASLRAELRDRVTENRQLRQEIHRALRLLEAGRVDTAATLLRHLTRPNP